MIVRALFFTLLGMIICSGILANAVTIGVYEHIQDEPTPGSIPAVRYSFVILSVIVLALGFRAYRRHLRGEVTSPIMRWSVRAVPFLVGIGAILGIWVGVAEMQSHKQYNEEVATDLCKKTLEDESSIAACLPDGLLCLREGRDYDRQLSRNLRRMGRDVEMQCLRRRGAEKSWVMRPEEKN